MRLRQLRKKLGLWTTTAQLENIRFVFICRLARVEMEIEEDFRGDSWLRFLLVQDSFPQDFLQRGNALIINSRWNFLRGFLRRFELEGAHWLLYVDKESKVISKANETD